MMHNNFKTKRIERWSKLGIRQPDITPHGA
jgi:hypothetical protein